MKTTDHRLWLTTNTTSANEVRDLRLDGEFLLGERPRHVVARLVAGARPPRTPGGVLREGCALLRGPPRRVRAERRGAGPLLAMGRRPEQGAGAPPGRRRGDGDVVLPGRHRGIRAGPEFPRHGEGVLRPRHAGHAGEPARRQASLLHRPARTARLRPRAELHRWPGAGRTSLAARRRARRDALRPRRSGGPLPGD